MSAENCYQSATMHPVIRVFCLLAFLLFLARGTWFDTLLALLVVAAVYGLARVGRLAQLGRMLQRLRYFFIAIVLVYGLATPGTPVADLSFAAWLTVEGIQEGAIRALALVLVVAAVHAMLELTRRDQLAAALYWLLRPLSWVGIRAERFILRLVLTLDRIEQMLGAIDARPARASEPRATLLQRAATAFEQALANARSEPPVEVSLTLSRRPALTDWLLGAVCIGGLFGGSMLLTQVLA